MLQVHLYTMAKTLFSVLPNLGSTQGWAAPIRVNCAHLFSTLLADAPYW